MRKFKSIDHQALRAFYFAAHFENFTKASVSANLTQSGISQHVAHLEADLGVSLFIRVGRKVTLTEAGKKLKEFSELYLDGIDNLFEKMGKMSNELTGDVSYAMPASCLMTPHFSKLLDARKDFSRVHLKVQICHSEEVVEKLIKGEIDVGFITKLIQHKDVEQLEFAQEEYVLVGSDKKMIQNIEIKKISDLSFISYPGMDYLFETWYSDHRQSKAKIDFNEMRISGQVNDLKAAITMVQHGVGLGIFPKHCVQEYLLDRTLFSHKADTGNSKSYPIYLVKLKGVKPLARIEKVIEEFLRMKRSQYNINR